MCFFLKFRYTKFKHRSPINIGSPSSYKSPSKDYGINERIEIGKDKIISGYDRWNLATTNGSLCINIIHNAKDKARRSNETVYPEELGNYCKKMQAVRAVLIDEIKSLKLFRKEITGSLAILNSMGDNEVLKTKLEMVHTFFTSLLELYEANFERKSFVIGEYLKLHRIFQIIPEFYRKHCSHRLLH